MDARRAVTGPGAQRSYDYASWSEFLGDVDGEHIPARFRGAGSGYDREQLGGCTSYDQLHSLAHNGWAEGMRHVHEVAIPAVQAVVSARVAQAGWAWDVTGAAYDLGEYLTGAPECWLTPDTETTRPVIRIQVNLGLRFTIPGRMVTLRGAGVVALTLALQAAGYVVEVFAICGSGIYENRQDLPYWLRVPLTDAAGGPLDVDRLLFALAHPVMPRICLFGMGAVLHGYPGSYATHEGGQNPWTADLVLRRIREDEADWQNTAAVAAWVKRTFDNLTQERS